MVTHTKQSQPVLSAREINVLEVDGLQFKDLNKNGVLDPYEDWRLPIEERVADLLRQMTLEEKVGLMFHPPLGSKPDGALSEDGVFPGVGLGATESILNRHFVHFNTWISAAAGIIAIWTNNAQAMAEKGRLGIPVTISSDPRNHYTHRAREGGFEISTGSFSLWPQPIGLGAIGDAELVERFAQIIAQEYRAVGLRTALHPQADLATEPRWGRISGTFGEEAELAAKLTAAYVRGLQGESLNPESVTAMVKHFPGGGPQWDGRDAHNEWGQEQFYPGDNFEYHLIPFRAAIEAGMGAVMPYYGIPMNQTKENVAMGFNREIITDLLREKMGYDGVVCTDWGITTRMPWGVQNLTEVQRYKKAIDAGVDQFGGGENNSAVLELVNTGQISESRVDESARRLLRNIFALGLFENPFVDAERTESIIGNAAFQAAADEAQRRSVVLLQNQNLLPLANGTKIYVENIDPEVAGQYGQVVFESNREGNIAIFTMNILTGAVERISPESEFDRAPVWSPDGKSIAFASFQDNTWGIFVISLESGLLRWVTDTTRTNLQFNWAPTGNRLVMVGDTITGGIGQEIYTLDLTFGARQRLTENKSFDSSPAWSPDGKWIAFMSNREKSYDLYVMDSRGQNPRRVTHNDGFNNSPAWSPNGDWISFTMKQNGNFDIYMVRPDGTDLRRLTSHSASDNSPAWRPQ